VILRRSQRPFWRTRTLRYTLIVTGAIGGVLLFLLASASSNTPLFERAYPYLLGANATIALTMVLLVGIQVWRLGKRYRAGVFGARMMARFALSFALMGLVPGVVIYMVSVQFLSRSIESWFDVRVDRALDAGLTLGRTVLDSMLSDLNNKARNISLSLSDSSDTELAKQLNRLREQSGVQAALIFNSNRVVASAGGGSLDTLVPAMPSPDILRQLKLSRSYARVESPRSDSESARGGLQIRVIVPIPSANFSLFQSDPLYLQLLQPVPSAVAANLDEAQSGVQDYRELSLSRTALRGMYTVTLTLALLLSTFAALAVAFLLATWLTAPLLLLAEGTKAVAGGDYSPMQEINTRDELGTLTQSFNAMTRQLSEARAVVEHNRAQLENSKTYLESILSNLSAGVLVFDDQFRLVTANHGAERILGTSFAAHLGRPLEALPALAKLSEMIERAFDEQADAGPDWQKQIELTRGGDGVQAKERPDGQPEAYGAGDPLTLLARGSRCPVGDVTGYLVVFDDVSDVISAQRSIAWSEVARRLAHEIKNPLTPIQLSAERLQMKLEGKLPENDAEVLDRGVATIVNQVAAMKQMVDDFRDFARAPPAAMAAVDLNALVAEVLALYGAVSSSDPQAELVLELGPDVPLILGDATRLRQVIHNLVQNAQDATYETAHPRIVFLTEKVDARASGPSRPGRDAMVRLTVSDNGSGFPARILARAFEPYVTTKSRGTGLGLAVVKKIADEHGARIDLRNRDEGGASVSLLFTKLAGRQLAVA
jgi:nitrogen fixation/metabolism regulation signal transduction histidine kinase